MRHVTVCILSAALLLGCAPEGPPTPVLPDVTSVSPLEMYTGEQVYMTADTLGNRNTKVYWDLGGAAEPNNSSDKSFEVTGGAPGTYAASVAYGNKHFDFTLTVTLPPLPTAEIVSTSIPYFSSRNGHDFVGSSLFVATPASFFVNGDHLQLSGPDFYGSGRRVPVTSWEWDFGAGCTPSHASGQQPLLLARGAGTYDATVTLGNAAGKAEPFHFTYEVLPLLYPPHVNYVQLPYAFWVGNPTTFVASYSNGPTNTVLWNFGGGMIPNTASERYPEVTPATAGTYQGTLTVSNKAGSETTNFTYTVKPIR